MSFLPTGSVSPMMSGASFGKKSFFSYSGGKPYFFSLQELQNTSKAVKWRALNGRRSGVPSRQLSEPTSQQIAADDPFPPRRDSAQTSVMDDLDALDSIESRDPVPLPVSMSKHLTKSQFCRFSCFQQEKVESDEGERVRYFTLTYYLKDGTISLMEPHVQNSGLVLGNVGRG